MVILSACMSIPLACLISAEARKGHQICQNWVTDGCEPHMGAGVQTQVLWKGIICCYPLSHLSSPMLSSFNRSYLNFFQRPLFIFTVHVTEGKFHRKIQCMFSIFHHALLSLPPLCPNFLDHFAIYLYKYIHKPDFMYLYKIQEPQLREQKQCLKPPSIS